MPADQSSGRDIPSGIKREVRQRCGFGCVLCGTPLYHYDHLDGWAETHRHDVNRIALLCAKHHDEKTRGVLAPEIVEQAAAAPVNVSQGESASHTLHFAGTTCSVKIGSNTFIADPLPDGGMVIPISVDGQPLVSMRRQNEELLLSLTAFDWFNNGIALIEDNELKFAAAPWDITWIGRRIRVDLVSGWTLLELELEPPNAVSIHKGRFLSNGVWIEIDHGVVRIANYEVWAAGNTMRGPAAGIVIGDMPEGANFAAFRYQRVFRYSRGMAEELGVDLAAPQT